ncbi:MAG: hypothetical protein ACXWW7_07955 [Nocardioides sp.]
MTVSEEVVERDARRAWLSLLLYPLSFAAAFLVGEGLAAAMGYPSGGAESPPWFVVLLAGLPALTVFAIPGLLSLKFGRRAAQAGADSAMVPAVIGILVALAFFGLNLLAFLVTGL